MILIFHRWLSRLLFILYHRRGDDALAEPVKEKESKTTTTKETYTSERWGKEGGTTIHQISFTVDISKIKDLPLLYKLIDELKDAQNRTDSPTPATT